MDFNFDTGTIDTILTLDTTEAPPLGGQTNVLVVLGSGALALPLGATLARPATPAAGMVRFNNTAGNGFLEYYDNSPGWQQLSSASGTVSSITVTTGTGMQVSAGSTQTITSTGTFALTLSSALQSISSLASSGVVVNNAGTYSAVTITGTAGNITVTNGSGTAGNPTINLATVANAGGGALLNFAIDTFGRVTGTSAVTQANLTSVIGNFYLPETGGTMSGAINMGGNQINNMSMAITPASSDATTVGYVQSLINGLSWKQEADVSTTADLGTVTYNNGASGVGATLTNAGTQVALTLDGVLTTVGMRVLVKNQTSSLQNGIYSVTTVGSGATNWVLTRTTDANSGALLDGAAIFVTQGTSQTDTGWVQTDASVTVGTSPITFAQFSGSNTYTAGTGLSLIGNTFANTGVLSFSAGSTGFTPSTSTTGVVTLAGSLNPANGGTGLSSAPTAGQIAVGTTGGTYVLTTIASGTGITVTSGSGTISVANAGVLSITGTANQITASASTGAVTLSLPANVTIGSSLTVSGLTANSMIYSGTAGLITSAGAATNGQLLIGSTGVAPVLATLATSGVGISVTNGAGTITLANTGVTSNVAGTGISVSGATGAVTITNTGVTSWSAGTTGLTPNTATTGAVSLAGTLAVANGGTGLATTPANGQIDIGNGTNFTRTTITAGTGMQVVNAAGSITLNNTGVTSVGMTVPSFLSVTPSTITTTGTFAITLATETANTGFFGPTTGGPATPTFRALVYGDLPLKLYAENPSTPVAPSATGANAIALGSASLSSQIGGVVQASGQFAAAGDAQHGTYVLRNTTSNATQTELFLDGSSTDFIVPGSSVVTFEVTVAAINTAVTGAGGGFKIQGVVFRGATAATTAFIGTPAITIIGRSPNGLNVAALVNTTTGALRIMVTGVAATTYHWVATLETTEVGAT